MELLLDIHAFIWFINGDTQLPKKSINLIKNLNCKCYVSIASIWEIAIKVSLGKLVINCRFEDIWNLMLINKIELLPISFEHLQKQIHLEYHHRDPFDRIIISQALVENFIIVTKDDNFQKYNVKIVWGN